MRKRLQLYFHVSALAQTSASRPQPAVQRFADVAALFALQLAREVQDSGPRQVRNVGHDSLLCSVDVGLVGTSLYDRLGAFIEGEAYNIIL